MLHYLYACVDLFLSLIATILIFIQQFKLRKKLYFLAKNNYLLITCIKDVSLFLGTCIFSFVYLCIWLTSISTSAYDFFNNIYIHDHLIITLIFSFILSPLFSIPFVVLFIVIFSKSICHINIIHYSLLKNNNEEKIHYSSSRDGNEEKKQIAVSQYEHEQIKSFVNFKNDYKDTQSQIPNDINVFLNSDNIKCFDVFKDKEIFLEKLYRKYILILWYVVIVCIFLTPVAYKIAYCYLITKMIFSDTAYILSNAEFKSNEMNELKNQYLQNQNQSNSKFKNKQINNKIITNTLKLSHKFIKQGLDL